MKKTNFGLVIFALIFITSQARADDRAAARCTALTAYNGIVSKQTEDNADAKDIVHKVLSTLVVQYGCSSYVDLISEEMQRVSTDYNALVRKLKQ